MIPNPFAWLRRRVAESVIYGVADGLRAVTPDGEEVPANVEELRELLATAAELKALPAPAAAADDKPAKSGRGR